jgi:hypothetical protein
MQSIDKLVSGSLRGIKSLYFLCKQIDLNIINQKSVQSSPKCWCKFLCHNGYCYAAWFSNTSAEVLEKFWRAV